jgi:hypothetical protein
LACAVGEKAGVVTTRTHSTRGAPAQRQASTSRSGRKSRRVGSCGVGRGDGGVGCPDGLFGAKGLFELPVRAARRQREGTKTEEAEAVVGGWEGHHKLGGAVNAVRAFPTTLVSRLGVRRQGKTKLRGCRLAAAFVKAGPEPATCAFSVQRSMRSIVHSRA